MDELPDVSAESMVESDELDDSFKKWIQERTVTVTDKELAEEDAMFNAGGGYKYLEDL